MKTIRLHSIGEDVLVLQELLQLWGYEVEKNGLFDEITDRVVRTFQRSNRLGVDGIVGKGTWAVLQDNDARALQPLKLSEQDFVDAADKLQVEVATVKAVQEVETGGKGGFFTLGKPAILFEGHIFWNELKKRGINPEDYAATNGDILYPKWTKEHYKGGVKEYARLERAVVIHEEAALCSASWGMFQIMGFNHAVSGCKNVIEFVEQMKSNEGRQLNLFVNFVLGNKMEQYLRNKDWAGFARRYNGPAYAQNAYDTKLQKAYLKYRG